MYNQMSLYLHHGNQIRTQQDRTRTQKHFKAETTEDGLKKVATLSVMHENYKMIIQVWGPMAQGIICRIQIW